MTQDTTPAPEHADNEAPAATETAPAEKTDDAPNGAVASAGADDLTMSVAAPSEAETETAEPGADESTPDAATETATTESGAAEDSTDAIPVAESTDQEAASPAPAAESLDAETPAAEAPAAEAPAAEAPAAETPDAEAPAAEAPAAEAPAAETPDAEAPAAEAAPAAPSLSVPDPVVAKSPGSIDDLDPGESHDDFLAAIERTVVEFGEGDLVEGTVVRIDHDEVMVDIGYKSEGVIPANELSIRNDVDPGTVVNVGDTIEALVLQKEDQDGRLILSKKRAQYERAWGKVQQVMTEGGTVTGTVIEVVKGGLIVDIGLRGFLPASLVELRRVRDLQPYVGQELEAKVIELDKNRNNVVLSRRAFLEEEQAEQRHAFLDQLQPGEVRTGVVSSVVNFGAFVDLGGMDGLVHVSELSWEHVNHPGEVVSVGDEVQVRVLEVDRDRERISLSVRQTREDPWESFADKHEVGDVLEGKVTKTVPFGAFVSVADGVEGLVHVSEIAVHHVESPELELSVGQSVSVKITEVDADRRRISLSIKQASPEWRSRQQSWAGSGSEQPPRRQPQPKRPERREFTREEEAEEQPAFNADASLEAILQELKEKGIGRK